MLPKPTQHSLTLFHCFLHPRVDALRAPLVHVSGRGLTGVPSLCSQVSMASLKDLDQRLFESYIELKADPIVGSLEPGIYAGYFDWRDCLPPTGGWFQVPGLQVHAS